MSFPHPEFSAAPRTHASVIDTVSSPEFQACTPSMRKTTFSNTFKGVVHESPLLSVPMFDIVHDVPVDKMHCVDLGVVRTLFWRTFEVKRITGLQRQRMDLAAFNSTYPEQPHIAEQTRRPVPYRVTWKATEYRSLLNDHIVYFLNLLNAHPDRDRATLQSVWALLAFIVRALQVEDSAKYEELNQEVDVASPWTNLCGSISVTLVPGWYTTTSTCFNTASQSVRDLAACHV